MADGIKEARPPVWMAALLAVVLAALGLQSVFLYKVWKSLPDDRRTGVGAVPSGRTTAPGAGSADPKSGDPFEGWDSMFNRFDREEWDPFEEMRHMREQMDSLFDDSFGRFSLTPKGRAGAHAFAFSPNLDLQEKDDRFVARMDIPGADKNNLSVKLEDRELTVSGQISESSEKKDGQQVLRKERRSGSFRRSILLPGPVEADKLEARYENGVLTITIPKAKEEKPSTKIQVK